MNNHLFCQMERKYKLGTRDDEKCYESINIEFTGRKLGYQIESCQKSKGKAH